jgi:hypothetical protein
VLRVRCGTTDLYPTLADREAAAQALNASPAVVALYGPIPDVDSLGQLAMTKTTVLHTLGDPGPEGPPHDGTFAPGTGHVVVVEWW